MTKKNLCEMCNGRLYRSYVRLNPKGKIDRKWTPIGFYCLNCEINFSDKKKKKTKKSKQK